MITITRKILTDAELEDLQEHFGTEGRKRSHQRPVKMPRKNMSFVPSNIKYLAALSENTGIAQTRIVNAIIELYRKEHPETTKEANAELLDFIAEKYTYKRLSEIIDN